MPQNLSNDNAFLKLRKTPSLYPIQGIISWLLMQSLLFLDGLLTRQTNPNYRHTTLLKRRGKGKSPSNLCRANNCHKLPVALDAQATSFKPSHISSLLFLSFLYPFKNQKLLKIEHNKLKIMAEGSRSLKLVFLMTSFKRPFLPSENLQGAVGN